MYHTLCTCDSVLLADVNEVEGRGSPSRSGGPKIPPIIIMEYTK